MCKNFKKWLKYLKQDLQFAKKSCTFYLSSIILVEMEFVYKTRFKKWSEFCHPTSIQKFYSYKDMIHNIRGFILAQCHKEQLSKVINAITTIVF